MKNKTTKVFNCPVCGNEIPCTDNKQIRCPWCKRLIIPRGYKTSQKEAEIFKTIEV